MFTTRRKIPRGARNLSRTWLTWRDGRGQRGSVESHSIVIERYVVRATVKFSSQIFNYKFSIENILSPLSKRQKSDFKRLKNIELRADIYASIDR